MTTHDFKTGDLVRIRSFEELCNLEGTRISPDGRFVWVKEFPETCYNKRMTDYADRVLTIKRIMPNGGVLFEEGSPGQWAWTVGFIDHVYCEEPEIPMDMIVGAKGGT